MNQALQTELNQGVATLRLNRPDIHNAFDDALIAELTEALQALDADPAVRAVVLSGDGSTFSAGADLGWMRRMARASEAENREDSLRLAALMRTLNFLFLGDAPPPCLRAADFDDNARVEITDAIASLSFLFAGGPGPAPPGEDCGGDPTPDALSCDASTSC